MRFIGYLGLILVLAMVLVPTAVSAQGG